LCAASALVPTPGTAVKSGLYSGNFAGCSSPCRRPGLVNIDFSLARNFAIRENLRLQFRAEALNLPNHPNFNYPSSTQNSPSFGHIASANDPRQIQLGLKLVF
jgi:hypothetical protein